jgi:hypothetical protein
MDDDLNRFLADYPEEVKTLSLKVRGLVLEVFPAAIEQVDPPSRIIGYGVDRTYRGMVCAIAPQRGYVNLMFAKGTELTDTEQLLEGTGKRARHVKIRQLEDVERKGLRALLEEAVELTMGTS